MKKSLLLIAIIGLSAIAFCSNLANSQSSTTGTEDKFEGNKKQKAVLDYLSSALDSKSQMFLTQDNYKVKYLDYDWSLNKQ